MASPSAGVEGLSVAGVVPGSDAERMGLQAGDLVIALNGTAISDIPQSELMSSLRRADLIATVRRHGEELELVRSP